MDVKEIRESLGMTQIEFSQTYKIPCRTLQSWEGGERKPPEYVIELLERAVRQDYPERLKKYEQGIKKILRQNIDDNLS